MKNYPIRVMIGLGGGAFLLSLPLSRIREGVRVQNLAHELGKRGNRDTVAIAGCQTNDPVQITSGFTTSKSLQAPFCLALTRSVRPTSYWLCIGSY